MKLEWKTCFRLGVTVAALFALIHYWAAFSRLVLTALGAAAPLFLGCVIAYIVNILMSFYERRWFPRSESAVTAKLRRPVCMLLAFCSFAAIVALVVGMVLPELADCVQLLVKEIPPLFNQITANWPTLAAALTELGLPSTAGGIDWQSVMSSVTGWLANGFGGMVSGIGALLSSIFSGLVTVLVGLIFSIYLLSAKEQLAAQFKRLGQAYLPARQRGVIGYVLGVLNDSFHHFFVGQCTEAVILGLLCMAGMALFRFPYATMIGTLIGFTALIPVAGAYIGAVVGALMILTHSPLQALLFLVFLVVLQQLEGNLIYPRVVGSSIGLPGLWVLAAVTVGGSIGGIGGMLLGVPLAAAAYRLLRTDVRKRTAAARVQAAQLPAEPQE